MRLADGPRQILAGVVSAGAFLALFFGLNLVWWLALVLAALVYGAVLLIVQRKPDLSEIAVGMGASEADLHKAGLIMDEAAARLDATQQNLPATDADVVEQLALHVRSIRTQVVSDPQDYRRARRFISSYLGHMVETVERYADLNAKSRGRHEERLRPLSDQIKSYLPALEQIDTACLENDFAALESQMKALAFQMERG